MNSCGGLGWAAAGISLAVLLSMVAGPNAADASNAAKYEKRAVTYEDLERVSDAFESFDLSKDGTRIAYEQRGKIFSKETRGRTAIVELGEGTLPKWSPDGSRLAYYSSATGSLQLWVYDLRVGVGHAVTALPAGIDPDPRVWLLSGAGAGGLRYDWSPDGSKLIFASRVPPNAPNGRKSGTASHAVPSYMPLVLDGSTDPDLTIAGIFPRKQDASVAEENSTSRIDVDSAAVVSQLFVVELKDNQATVLQLTAGNAGYFQPAWSSDGISVACMTTEGGAIDGRLETSDIVRIDAATGKRLGQTSGSGLKYLPTWSASGRQVVFLENKDEGVYGAAALYAWDWRDGSASALAPELRSRVRRYRVGPIRDEVFFLYRDGLRSLLERVGFDGRPPRLVRVEDEQRMPYDFELDRKGEVAWILETSDNPGLIELISSKREKPKTIVDLNPDSARWLHGKRRAVHWTNARGDKLDGIVIEPPGFDPTRPYPMIVDAYPLVRGDAWGVLSGNQVWASRGYLIFVPAARGPHVWMNDWSTRSYGLVARGRDGWDITQDDLMSGVNTLVARGLADRTRMCIYGHSNGGGVALNVIARTNLFACAVAVAPADLDWLTSSTLETNSDAWATRTVGSTSVFDDPETYLKLSVLYRASAVNTPTLLAIGDYDGPESLLATIEMFNSLRDLGRNVTLLRYRDQGHVFHGAAMKDFWDRELKFFDDHLRVIPSSP